MKFVISLILNIALSGGLVLMVNELFQTNHDLEKLNEEIFSQYREHSRIVSNYNELEAELEQAKTDMSKLSDMFAIHMRSHR
tara:strand:- start:181 stop:426 length:246 start_codon:yes stop_codon:yes gene_type:complete